MTKETDFILPKEYLRRADEKELEKEAKQSYLNTTEETQWSEVDEFEYTRGYLAGAEPREKRIEELEAQIEKMQEKLKADLIARLEEQIQYSTSPSCTKGMELFIRSINEWEIKEK